VSVATKENGTQVVAVTTALDFLGADFNVTESPSGEANVSLAVTPEASGTAAGLIATHAADTTSVHGITDTSALALTANVIANTLVDAKGDLVTATADNTPARLAAGTNGYVLTADSGEATGLKWAAASGGSDPLDGNALIAQRIFVR
jgi:hypothetical protein